MDAIEKVLRNKLQLELVPYASSKFQIVNKERKLLVPYIETVLDEIFKKERKYVIFGGGIFENLFSYYNKNVGYTFDLSSNKVPFTGLIKKDGIPYKITPSCKVIKIHYSGKVQKALIANTFSSQALSNAFDVMEKYGCFCYNHF